MLRFANVSVRKKWKTNQANELKNVIENIKSRELFDEIYKWRPLRSRSKSPQTTKQT